MGWACAGSESRIVGSVPGGLVSEQGALGAGTLVLIDRDPSERWLLGQSVMA
jgi:hypothetical protein